MFVNNNSNRQSNQYQKDYRNRQNDHEYTPRAMALENNYVDLAEKVMRENHRNITSSKLRSILSMVSSIYNTERVGDKELSETSQNSLRMLRVRIIYEYGRNDAGFKSLFVSPTFLTTCLTSEVIARNSSTMRNTWKP